MVPAISVALSLGKVVSRSRIYDENTEAQVQVAGNMLPSSTKQAITTAVMRNPSLSVSNRPVWSCWSHLDPEGYPALWSSLEVVSTGTEQAAMCEFFPYHLIHVPQHRPEGTPSGDLYHSMTACHSIAIFDQAAPVGNAKVLFFYDAWQPWIQ